MRLPEKYRWLEPELHLWAQWGWGLGPALGDSGENVLSRMEREIRVGASQKRDCRVPECTYMPDDVERVESAVLALPQHWQQVVVFECIRRYPHKVAAKKMHISRPTHLAWRLHAYGMIAERLKEPEEYFQPLYVWC